MAERLGLLDGLRKFERTFMVAGLQEEAAAIAGIFSMAEDLIAFAQDADCNCRPSTEKYEAHTCRRCELLARIEP
jgi:hypothetical protein